MTEQLTEKRPRFSISIRLILKDLTATKGHPYTRIITESQEFDEGIDVDPEDGWGLIDEIVEDIYDFVEGAPKREIPKK